MSLEDIPFQPRIWRYPEKVLGEEARTPRDKRWPSFLHGEWRTDSLEAGCLDPAPQSVLAGTLQNRSCSFREMPAAEGPMGWWVGDGPRPSRQSGQSERQAGCTPQCGLEAAALVHGLGRLL